MAGGIADYHIEKVFKEFHLETKDKKKNFEIKRALNKMFLRGLKRADRFKKSLIKERKF